MKRKIISLVMLCGLLALSAAYSFISAPFIVAHAQAATPVPTQMSNSLIAIEPSKPNVNPGDNFDINVSISTDVQCRAVQIQLSFDPSLVELTGFDEGNFFKDFASSKGGSATTMMVPQPVIDNQNGKVSLFSINIMGVEAGGGGAIGKGILITFHATAKANAKGSATVKLEKVALADAGDQAGTTQYLGGVKAQDGVIAIGAGSAPAATLKPVQATVVIGGGQQQAQTAEPTIAKKTSLDTSDTGGSLPWEIIIPVIGVVLVGGIGLVVLRKK